MHLSDVLLGVSSLMSVWSSGENRATETETRGDIEAMGNSYLPKSITANRLVSYSSRYHLGFRSTRWRFRRVEQRLQTCTEMWKTSCELINLLGKKVEEIWMSYAETLIEEIRRTVTSYNIVVPDGFWRPGPDHRVLKPHQTHKTWSDKDITAHF